MAPATPGGLFACMVFLPRYAAGDGMASGIQGRDVGAGPWTLGLMMRDITDDTRDSPRGCRCEIVVITLTSADDERRSLPPIPSVSPLQPQSLSESVYC